MRLEQFYGKNTWSTVFKMPFLCFSPRFCEFCGPWLRLLLPSFKPDYDINYFAVTANADRRSPGPKPTGDYNLEVVLL